MKTMLADAAAEAAAVRHFIRHLSASRLLPPDEVEELERRARFIPLPDLQAELIRDERLTRYQVQRLASGQSDGLVMGKYRILCGLGDGGFGNVYLAYHTLMHRQVALKVLSNHTSNDPMCNAMFRREVVASTRLAHPNIAAALDADDCDGQLFLVMEYVEGPTLEAYTSTNNGVSAALARTILLQAALALQYASQLGFVHRDVKPANMILSGVLPQSPDDPGSLVCVKLLDFGLARVPAAAPNTGIICTLPCGDGSIVGTPAYMAPEQIGNPHAADVRSDLYSLGCTLFYALTSHLPFPGKSISEVVRKHLIDPPPAALLSRPEIPPSLAAVILRLMAKDPADRFQTPRELITALNEPVPAPPAPLSVSELAPGGPLSVPITERRLSASAPPPEHEFSTPALPQRTQVAVVSPPPKLNKPPACDKEADLVLVPVPVPADDALSLWAEWLGVLSEVTGHESERSEVEYRGLYSRLLTSVTAVERSRPAGEREVWQRMAAAVEPWVSLRSLDDLDGRMLASLRKTCGAIDASVRPPKRRPLLGWWFLAAVVLAAVAAGLYGVLA